MGAVRRATWLRALRVLPLPHRCRRQVDVGYGEGLEERVYNALPVVLGLEHVGGDEDVDLLRVDVEQVGERVVPVALHRVPIRNDTVRQWSAVVAHPLQARRRQHRLRCLRAGEPDLDAPAPVVDDHAGRLTAEWSGRGRQHRGRVDRSHLQGSRDVRVNRDKHKLTLRREPTARLAARGRARHAGELYSGTEAGVELAGLGRDELPRCGRYLAEQRLGRSHFFRSRRGVGGRLQQRAKANKRASLYSQTCELALASKISQAETAGCRHVGVCAGRARGPPCVRGARADACRQASQMPARRRASHADRSRARKRRAHVSVWARGESGAGHVLGRVGGGGGVHAAGMPHSLEPQTGRRYRQVCYSRCEPCLPAANPNPDPSRNPHPNPHPNPDPNPNPNPNPNPKLSAVGDGAPTHP